MGSLSPPITLQVVHFLLTVLNQANTTSQSQWIFMRPKDQCLPTICKKLKENKWKPMFSHKLTFTFSLWWLVSAVIWKGHWQDRKLCSLFHIWWLQQLCSNCFSKNIQTRKSFSASISAGCDHVATNNWSLNSQMYSNLFAIHKPFLLMNKTKTMSPNESSFTVL